MADLSSGKELDWDTLKWVIELLKRRREKYVDEYDNGHPADWRKDHLLVLRMETTDIRAEIQEEYFRIAFPPADKKDS